MPPGLLGSAMLGGGVLSAGTQIMGGIWDKKASDAQANAYQQQAGLVREQAGAQIAAQDYATNKAVSEGKAAAAASGVVPGTGSAAVISRLNTSYGVLRDIVTKYSGDIEAQKLLVASANSRLQGKQALYGSIAGAGKSLLTSSLGTFAPTAAGGLGLKPKDLLNWSTGP
jgi:hypothetical protein